MQLQIDSKSGFCFGVINAIKAAEKALETTPVLYCLGDIVHNNEEIHRLSQLGLRIITPEEFERMHDETVLIRAHGEPPKTYQIAEKNNLKLIDATCPVVLKLQKRIKETHELQTLIFGKEGHAEVIGLVGQTDNQAIVISSQKDISKINFDLPSVLFSQTTQNTEEFAELVKIIRQKYQSKHPHHPEMFRYADTICRSVSNRAEELTIFAQSYDVIIFVSGKKSSNGNYLYEVCKKANPQTHFISNIEELNPKWFKGADSAGICGATSTPFWLMEKVKQRIEALNS